MIRPRRTNERTLWGRKAIHRVPRGVFSASSTFTQKKQPLKVALAHPGSARKRVASYVVLDVSS